MSRFWTEERVAFLKERRAAGATSNKIAAELGCSRFAVIGKLDRLGVPSPLPKGDQVARASSPARAERPARQRRPQTTVVMLDDLYAVVPSAGRLLYDHDLRRGHCRWVLPGVAPWTFCGEAVKPKSAWCAAHHARVFVPYRREKAE